MMKAFLLAAVSLLFVATTPAVALEPPKGNTILTVSGDIETANAAGAAEFDREMLAALDWREIETHTSFTHGPQRFAGPTLVSLLEALGVESGTIFATAINDYTVEIPVAHAAAHDVLLVMEHDGRPMRVRNKGPIWVVYPQSQEEAVRQTFDSEMIWQLTRMRIEQ